MPAESVDHISVTLPGHRRQRREIVCHVARRAAEVVVREGVRVSSPLRTFVDLAGQLGLVDLVVAGDALLRRFDIRSRDLVDFCAHYDGHHAALARRAAAFVREEVDSPMETRLRMLIVLAGLPEPRVNLKIRDEYGSVIMRFDLSYPGLKIAVEYDGRQHAEEPQRRVDIERRERLDNEGWRLIVISSAGIYREPEQTLRRVHGILVARGCPDLPRKMSNEWRRHFPNRS